MEQNFWNVFETSGDPMAYLIYTKSKNIEEYNKNMLQINSLGQNEKLVFLVADDIK